MYFQKQKNKNLIREINIKKKIKDKFAEMK